MQKCLKLKKKLQESEQARVIHLVTVCLFMWVYIPTRYHPNIMNSFGVIEYTQKFVKECKGK